MKASLLPRSRSAHINEKCFDPWTAALPLMGYFSPGPNGSGVWTIGLLRRCRRLPTKGEITREGGITRKTQNTSKRFMHGSHNSKHDNDNDNDNNNHNNNNGSNSSDNEKTQQQ